MPRDRRIRIRSVPKAEPDVRKLSRALIALAMAQAKQEKDAQEQDRPQTEKADQNTPRRPA